MEETLAQNQSPATRFGAVELGFVINPVRLDNPLKVRDYPMR